MSRLPESFRARHDDVVETRSWPANLVLAACWASVVGLTAWMYADSERFWLVAITMPVMAVGSMIILPMWRPQWFQRTAQIGLIVSITVHVLLLTTAANTDIFSGLAKRSESRPRPPKKRLTTLPASEPHRLRAEAKALREWTRPTESPRAEPVDTSQPQRRADTREVTPAPTPPDTSPPVEATAIARPERTTSPAPDATTAPARLARSNDSPTAMAAALERLDTPSIPMPSTPSAPARAAPAFETPGRAATRAAAQSAPSASTVTLAETTAPPTSRPTRSQEMPAIASADRSERTPMRDRPADLRFDRTTMTVETPPVPTTDPTPQRSPVAPSALSDVGRSTSTRAVPVPSSRTSSPSRESLVSPPQVTAVPRSQTGERSLPTPIVPTPPAAPTRIARSASPVAAAPTLTVPTDVPTAAETSVPPGSSPSVASPSPTGPTMSASMSASALPSRSRSAGPRADGAEAPIPPGLAELQALASEGNRAGPGELVPIPSPSRGASDRPGLTGPAVGSLIVPPDRVGGSPSSRPSSGAGLSLTVETQVEPSSGDRVAAQPSSPIGSGPTPSMLADRPLGRGRSSGEVIAPLPTDPGLTGPDLSVLAEWPGRETGRRPALARATEGPLALAGLTSDARPIGDSPSRPGRTSDSPARLNADTSVVAPAFQGRAGRIPGADRDPGDGELPPEVEDAIEKGLAFLARYQARNGAWSLGDFDEGKAALGDTRPTMTSDTAATALALLAFQGAGYTHREHGYRDEVRNGLAWLLAVQRPDGDLYRSQDRVSSAAAHLYSHAIATLALCEAYGMTGDDALRGPAQRAIDFVVASQDKTLGGWRYTPGYASDTSVTGWMVLALRSGQLAGLTVPDDTIRGVRHWLDRAEMPDQPYLYRYNPDALDTPEQRHGRRPTPTMTSVGLLSRLYLDGRQSSAQIERGAESLMNALPAMGTAADLAAGGTMRDTYYWYYATQFLYHVGGPRWERWNRALQAMLVETQETRGPAAGSWDPARPVPDRWGPHGGRIYVTTLNLLSLEVHYRHLPLYDGAAEDHLLRRRIPP